MRLTSWTGYTSCILTLLDVQEKEKLITIKEIVDINIILKKYLLKVDSRNSR